MSPKLLVIVMIGIASSTPVAAQDAFYSQADTGVANRSSQTSGGSRGSSARTRTTARLPGVTSGAPLRGGSAAPGNFALRQLGRNTLPPTRLNSFVNQGRDAVFGDEGRDGLPPYFSFTEEHRIERAMEHNPELTTNHHFGSPSAWDFPN
jgi:hypothetical protein